MVDGRLESYVGIIIPDNGTAGWFMDNFRNLLVMEDGRSDVDHGKITGTVEMPSRNPPKSAIVLMGLTGKVVVVAAY